MSLCFHHIFIPSVFSSYLYSICVCRPVPDCSHDAVCLCVFIISLFHLCFHHIFIPSVFAGLFLIVAMMLYVSVFSSYLYSICVCRPVPDCSHDAVCLCVFIISLFHLCFHHIFIPSVFAGLFLIVAMMLYVSVFSSYLYSICVFIISLFHLFAGLFLIVAMMLYPAGWGSRRVQQLCGSAAAPYILDECSLGLFLHIIVYTHQASNLWQLLSTPYSAPCIWMGNPDCGVWTLSVECWVTGISLGPEQ